MLTESELVAAYDLDHPYASSARRGYPYLFDASERIIDSGVNYFDATRIFIDLAEDVYQDKCCHVNRLGREHVARAIAVRVTDLLSSR